MNTCSHSHAWLTIPTGGRPVGYLQSVDLETIENKSSEWQGGRGINPGTRDYKTNALNHSARLPPAPEFPPSDPFNSNCVKARCKWTQLTTNTNDPC